MARLLVRADGNSQIGYGHLMRCMAIANENVFSEIVWFSNDPIEDLLSENLNSAFSFVKIDNEKTFFMRFQQKISSYSMAIILTLPIKNSSNKRVQHSF